MTAATTLRVVEHGELAIGADAGDDGLTAREHDHLCALRARTGATFFTEVRVDRRWRARFAHLVGAIALPGGRTLEILPKIGAADDPTAARLNLMRMLAATGQFPALSGDLERYAAGAHLIEAYLRMAAELAWRLIRTGLPRDYRREEARTPFLKGRWRVGRQLARSPLRHDRHEVALDLFTADTAHNRVLRAGLARMAPATRDAETLRLLRGVDVLLDGVADVVADRRLVGLLDGLAFDRRNAAWRPLFLIIRQFLRDAPADVAGGAAALGPAWLFDMNRLFEAYIAKRLRRVVPHLEVRERGPRRHLALDAATGRRRFGLLPDIVVGPPDGPRLIVDTKWKRLGPVPADDVAGDDLRQVYAYARIYGAGRVALAYPAPGAEPRRLTLWSNEAGAGARVRIEIVELPVQDDQAERLDALLRDLLRDDDVGDPGG